jgi:CARDB/Dockerin type I domain
LFKSLVVGFVLASLILPFTCMIQPLVAFGSGPSAAIRVFPENIAVKPGTTFPVNVTFENLPQGSDGATGCSFKLSWNSSILQCESMQEVAFHTAAPEWAWDNIWKLQNIVNNTGGYVKYAYTWQDINQAILDGYAFISDNGTWATLTFTALNLGQTTLRFDEAQYANSSAKEITSTKFNGQVSVVGPPSATITPDSVVIDLSQSQLFTSIVSGGTSPYSYQWYLNGSSVSGATGMTWTFTPVSSGSNGVYLNVTDSFGYEVKSNAANIMVNAPPSVTISPDSVVMNVNESQLFTSTIFGGTSPYYYQWYLNTSIVSGATGPSWAFVPSVEGSYTAYLKVTDNLGVQATSNFAYVTVNSIEPLVHDVALTDVKTSKDGCTPMPTVADDSYVTVNVTVVNRGNFTETFDVTLYANLSVVGTQTVSGLAAAAQTVLTYTWNVAGWTRGDYMISAYAVPVPEETNTADNSHTGSVITVVIPGDINGDGTVDIFDAILLAGAYNTASGGPNWSPNADINGGGTVDIFDAIILANHCNQHYP